MENWWSIIMSILFVDVSACNFVQNIVRIKSHEYIIVYLYNIHICILNISARIYTFAWFENCFNVYSRIFYQMAHEPVKN